MRNLTPREKIASNHGFDNDDKDQKLKSKDLPIPPKKLKLDDKSPLVVEEE